MYSGVSGLQMKADIFMGIVYYQRLRQKRRQDHSGGRVYGCDLSVPGRSQERISFPWDSADR